MNNEGITEDDIKVLKDIKKVFKHKDHKAYHAKVVEDKDGKLKVYEVNMKRIS